MRTKRMTDRGIMRERLPVGLFALIGQQGAGKTSCGVAMLCNDWKFHHSERYQECEEYIKECNRNGFNLHLPKNKTIYYSPDEIILDLKRNIKTWYIDPEKFKLPNLKEDVQYVPRGSVVFLPEFDNIINCRDWKSMSPYLVALAKYARHWDLTIIIDFQCWMQLDISWRRLMMYTLFMLETYDCRFLKLKKFLGLKPKRYWNYVFCRNQLNSFVKDLSDMSVESKLVKKLQKRVAVDRKYVFKGDTRLRYNDKSGELYFLNGIEDYEYIEHKPVKLSPDGVKEYCRTHPVVRGDKAC